MKNFVKTERFTSLLIEVIVIVISVLLALAVNEWRQERNNQRMVERVLKNIESEIRQNQEGLAHAYKYHKELVSDLREGRHVRLVESVPLKDVPFQINDVKTFREGMKEKLLNYGLSPTVGFGLRKISEDRYELYVGNGEGYVEIENDSLKIFMQKGIQLRSAFVQNNAWELAVATRATIHMDFDIVAKMSIIHKSQKQYEETVSTILNLLYSGDFRLAPLSDLVYYEEELLKYYDEILVLLERSG